jgi:hypothetical protein
MDFNPLYQLVSPFSESDKMPWGGAPKCPACDRNVYPMDQVIAADRQDHPSHPTNAIENAKPNHKNVFAGLSDMNYVEIKILRPREKRSPFRQLFTVSENR